MMRAMMRSGEMGSPPSPPWSEGTAWRGTESGGSAPVAARICTPAS